MNFMQKAIQAELERLQKDCALQRHILRNQRRCWWEPDRYWQLQKFLGLRDSRARVMAAELALSAHFLEHSKVMGFFWNDLKPRLCWNSFTGGYPIDVHYCLLPEGHDGHHQDNVGAWERASSPAHPDPKPHGRIKIRKDWARLKNLPLP